MSVWVRQGERWSDMKPFLIQNTLHCNDVFIFTLLPPPPLTPQHFRVCGEDSERRIGAADNLLQPEVPPTLLRVRRDGGECDQHGVLHLPGEVPAPTLQDKHQVNALPRPKVSHALLHTLQSPFTVPDYLISRK